MARIPDHDRAAERARGRLLSENDEVFTPHGLGTVHTVHIVGTTGVALVDGPKGLRPWSFRDLMFPDGSAVLTEEQQERSVGYRAQLAAAQTLDGTALKYGFRLTALNLSAGYGWILDPSGTRVAFVRARVGEDGRRYWWLQTLSDAPPFDWVYHEQELRPDRPHAALQAAGWISYLSDRERGDSVSPMLAHEAARRVTLTVARVRELRSLPLPHSPVTGQPVPVPDWRDRWRIYTLTVAQMVSLADAASAAVAAAPRDTAQQRRRVRVLTAAAEQLGFQAYDTARCGVAIPVPGTHDPYGSPYTSRPVDASLVDLDLLDSTDPAADAPVSNSPGMPPRRRFGSESTLIQGHAGPSPNGHAGAGVPRAGYHAAGVVPKQLSPQSGPPRLLASNSPPPLVGRHGTAHEDPTRRRCIDYRRSPSARGHRLRQVRRDRRHGHRRDIGPPARQAGQICTTEMFFSRLRRGL
ncbi:hypothetical protein [Nocardia terpenica]|uniref:hypothetical protein n=1 Tax=Nocardia terpenica TaxID=455432 RepID=UPI00142DF18C|nr:hypothetical protein [Nocardia terpenica]